MGKVHTQVAWINLPPLNHFLGELCPSVRVDDVTVLAGTNWFNTIGSNSGQTAKTFTELIVDGGTSGAI